MKTKTIVIRFRVPDILAIFRDAIDFFRLWASLVYFPDGHRRIDDVFSGILEMASELDATMWKWNEAIGAMRDAAIQITAIPARYLGMEMELVSSRNGRLLSASFTPDRPGDFKSGGAK